MFKNEAFLRHFLQKMKLWSSKTKLFCETSFKNETLKIKSEVFLRDFLQKRSFEAQKRSFSARLPSKMKLWNFLQKWSFEAQKQNFCARLPSKMKLWSSKTKLFCETSFKNETLKIKSEVFLRDFLQKRSFEAQHRSLFCETSFKNETLKFKNETFVRDFLQKWSFEDQKRSISARLPSKMTCWPHAWPQNYNTSYRFSSLCFKSTAPATKKLSRGIRSPVTATRNDQCKVTLPWHEICNPSTDSASKASNIDITKHEIIAPATRNASFRSLFKSPTPANVFATLTNSCACHAFWNVSKSLRLPRENHFEPQKVVRDPGVLTILTSKSFSCAGVVQILPASTSKSRPRLSVFNDFDFQIVLARRRGANFADLNFQKCSEGVSF